MSVFSVFFFIVFFITQSSAIIHAAAKSYLKKSITQTELPRVKPKYLKAGFWIEQLSAPDKVVKSASEVQRFNRKVKHQGTIVDPLRKSFSINYSTLQKYLKEDLSILRRYIKYDINGKRRRDPVFSNYLAKLVRLKQVIKHKKNRDTLLLKYAVVVKTTKLRSFPTDEVFMRRPGDEEFDIFIKSVLPLLNGVVVLWESRDKKWVYVETPFSRGWIKKNQLVVLKNREATTKFNPITPLLQTKLNKEQRVVIHRKATVYEWSKAERKWLGMQESLPMGSVVSIKTKQELKQTPTESLKENYQIIHTPYSKGDYAVKTSSLSKQFLDFTQRNVLKQVFQFLGSGYGWGGGLDQTDCSLFFYYVFRSFGVLLPRSSSQQVDSLKKILIQSLEELNQVFNSSARPGLALAHIRGPNHILLYLGKIKNQPFFIHSTWSFKDKKYEYITSSVVVSDLSLGENHYMGSLAQKIVKIGLFSNFINN